MSDISGMNDQTQAYINYLTGLNAETQAAKQPAKNTIQGIPHHYTKCPGCSEWFWIPEVLELNVTCCVFCQLADGQRGEA